MTDAASWRPLFEGNQSRRQGTVWRATLKSRCLPANRLRQVGSPLPINNQDGWRACTIRWKQAAPAPQQVVVFSPQKAARNGPNGSIPSDINWRNGLLTQRGNASRQRRAAASRRSREKNLLVFVILPAWQQKRGRLRSQLETSKTFDGKVPGWCMQPRRMALACSRTKVS